MCRNPADPHRQSDLANVRDAGEQIFEHDFRQIRYVISERGRWLKGGWSWRCLREVEDRNNGIYLCIGRAQNFLASKRFPLLAYAQAQVLVPVFWSIAALNVRCRTPEAEAVNSATSNCAASQPIHNQPASTNTTLHHALLM